MSTLQSPPQFQMIQLDKVKPNKVNPRGKDVKENDPHSESLKESIAEFGILVPLVVRRTDSDQYELIDGERRYWVAHSLRMKEVPAFVIVGDLAQREILQRMFQIHMNREEWGPVEQCRASEDLYEELLGKFEDDTEELISSFARFTGTDRRTARNRVQFLRWPGDIKRKIYEDSARHESYWYVVEIEDKIIEPALKNYPEYFDKVKVDDVRRFLYRKWEEGTLKAAIEVRTAGAIFRSRVEKKRERDRVIKIFDKLVKDVDITYQEAFEEFARQFPTFVEPKIPKPRALINSIRRLTDALSQYDLFFLQAYRGSKQRILNELGQALDDLVEAGRALGKRLK